MTGKIPMLISQNSIALFSQTFSLSVQSKHITNEVNDCYVLSLMGMVDNNTYEIFSFLLDMKEEKTDIKDYSAMFDILTLISTSAPTNILKECDGKAPINVIDAIVKELQKIIQKEDQAVYSSYQNQYLSFKRLLKLNNYSTIEEFMSDNPTMTIHDFVNN